MYIKRLNEKRALFSWLSLFSYLLFCTILIWGIYFKINDFHAIIKNYHKLEHLTNFQRFTYAINPFFKIRAKDVFLNVLAFAPFGFYLPLLFPRHTHFKGILCCFLVSLTVELMQFLTIVGTFSTIDLIANTCGYFVGAFFFELFIKRLPSRFINYLNMTVIAIASPIAVYGVINTVTHFTIYITKSL